MVRSGELLLVLGGVHQVLLEPPVVFHLLQGLCEPLLVGLLPAADHGHQRGHRDHHPDPTHEIPLDSTTGARAELPLRPSDGRGRDVRPEDRAWPGRPDRLMSIEGPAVVKRPAPRALEGSSGSEAEESGRWAWSRSSPWSSRSGPGPSWRRSTRSRSSGGTVREAMGYGRQKNRLHRYLGSEYNASFLPKVELTLFVREQDVPAAVKAIVGQARTGPDGGRQDHDHPLPGRIHLLVIVLLVSMGRADPEDPVEVGRLAGPVELDQDRRRGGGRVLGAEQGEPAAVLEPADERLARRSRRRPASRETPRRPARARHRRRGPLRPRSGPSSRRRPGGCGTPDGPRATRPGRRRPGPVRAARRSSRRDQGRRR